MLEGSRERVQKTSKHRVQELQRSYRWRVRPLSGLLTVDDALTGSVTPGPSRGGV